MANAGVQNAEVSNSERAKNEECYLELEPILALTLIGGRSS